MKNTVKNSTLYVAFVASLGGLLFRPDTAVISGAEKSIQTVYGLSDSSHGFTITIALIGTIIGTFICSKPVERYGRLKALKVITFLYFVPTVGSAAIIDWYSFLFFRSVGELAVGASSVVGLMYIAEIPPSRWRGRFVASFQFNIALDIVLAYFSNYRIHDIAHDWRWMPGVEAIPAVVSALLLYAVSESPCWLVKQDEETEARRIVKEANNVDIEQEVREIRESLVATGNCGEELFQRKYHKSILCAFLIATFNQLPGINAILYYAPRIFEMSGAFADSAMMQSIVIELTNLTFTMIGMILIDQVGRKKLPHIGSIGMAISSALVAEGFCQDIFSGYYMLACLVGFIAFFAISLGTVIWVPIFEVLPNSVRFRGQVLGSMIYWVWSALLSWMFPVSTRTGGTFIFSSFAIMMFLSFFFVLRLLETKNKSLEQIQEELTN